MNGCEIMRCSYWDKVAKECVYGGDICRYQASDYDTLKAKADMFDEMYPILDAIEKAYRSHEIRGETVNGNKLLSLARSILSKTEALK